MTALAGPGARVARRFGGLAVAVSLAAAALLAAAMPAAAAPRPAATHELERGPSVAVTGDRGALLPLGELAELRLLPGESVRVPVTVRNLGGGGGVLSARLLAEGGAAPAPGLTVNGADAEGAARELGRLGRDERIREVVLVQLAPDAAAPAEGLALADAGLAIEFALAPAGDGPRQYAPASAGAPLVVGLVGVLLIAGFGALVWRRHARDARG